MVHPDHDTLTLDMRCAAAVFEERVGLLHKELKLIGIDCSTHDIVARGDTYIDAWRIRDATKRTCYLCGARRAGDVTESLCTCFNAVKATRYFNVNDVFALTLLDPSTVVETIVCNKCGDLCPVSASQVRKAHEQRGRYQGFKSCEPCHKKFKKAQRQREKQPAQPTAKTAVQLHKAPQQAPVHKRQARAWQAHKAAPEPLRYQMRIPPVQTVTEALTDEVAGQITAGCA